MNLEGYVQTIAATIVFGDGREEYITFTCPAFATEAEVDAGLSMRNPVITRPMRLPDGMKLTTTTLEAE